MKNKMTKILSMLMAVATLGTVTACGGKNDGPKLEDGQVLLEISVFDGGYGTDWLEALKTAYMQKNSTVVIDYKTATNREKEQANEIRSGSAGSDLYFTGYNIHSGLYNDVNLAELTDVYTAVGDKLIPSVKNWYEHEGKQYSIPWATAPLGIVYHSDYFAEKGIQVPRTTNELFAAATTITENRKSSSDPYAFIYASKTPSECYLDYLFKPWMAQYEGVANYEKYFDVKLKDGTQYDEAFAYEYQGVLRTLEVYQEMLLSTNKYNYPNPQEDSFAVKQQYFLKQKAAMIINGDWVVNEILKGSYTEEQTKGLAFMKTPIISSIVETMPMWAANGDEGKHYAVDPKPANTNVASDPLSNAAVAISADKKASYDKALCAIIDYVDGVTTTKPTSVEGIAISEADITRIEEARSITPSMSCFHNAVIPSNSDRIEEAKDFLKFMYSDEGLDIYAQNSYGCGLPVQYTKEEVAEIAGDSKIVKSAYEMLDGAYLTFHTGSKNKAFCKNGLSFVYRSDASLFYSVFAEKPTSSRYENAYTFFKQSRANISDLWSNFVSGI
jgi:ABC-type glycerol-3-phosphate transport system substrate-binding protein